jgi:hypothetical protein
MAGRVTADCGANSMKHSYARMPLPVARLPAAAALKLPDILPKSPNFRHRIGCPPNSHSAAASADELRM